MLFRAYGLSWDHLGDLGGLCSLNAAIDDKKTKQKKRMRELYASKTLLTKADCELD